MGQSMNIFSKYYSLNIIHLNTFVHTLTNQQTTQKHIKSLTLFRFAIEAKNCNICSQPVESEIRIPNQIWIKKHFNYNLAEIVSHTPKLPYRASSTGTRFWQSFKPIPTQFEHSNSNDCSMNLPNYSFGYNQFEALYHRPTTRFLFHDYHKLIISHRSALSCVCTTILNNLNSKSGRKIRSVARTVCKTTYKTVYKTVY